MNLPEYSKRSKVPVAENECPKKASLVDQLLKKADLKAKKKVRKRSEKK